MMSSSWRWALLQRYSSCPVPAAPRHVSRAASKLRRAWRFLTATHAPARDRRSGDHAAPPSRPRSACASPRRTSRSEPCAGTRACEGGPWLLPAAPRCGLRRLRALPSEAPPPGTRPPAPRRRWRRRARGCTAARRRASARRSAARGRRAPWSRGPAWGSPDPTRNGRRRWARARVARPGSREASPGSARECAPAGTPRRRGAARAWRIRANPRAGPGARCATRTPPSRLPARHRRALAPPIGTRIDSTARVSRTCVGFPTALDPTSRSCSALDAGPCARGPR